MYKKYIKDCVDSIFSILPYYDAVSIIMGDKKKSFDVLYSKSLSDFLVQLQDEVAKNKDTFNAKYSKEFIIDFFIKYCEKEALLDLNKKEYYALVHAILKKMTNKIRIKPKIWQIIKNTDIEISEVIITLNGSMSFDDIYKDLYNLNTVDTLYMFDNLKYDFDEVIKNKPFNFYLPLSFYFMDIVNYPLFLIEQELNKLKGKKDYNLEVEKNMSLFFNLLKIEKEILEDYNKTKQSRCSENMLLGKIPRNIEFLYEGLESFEDIVEKRIDEFHFQIASVVGESYIVD